MLRCCTAALRLAAVASFATALAAAAAAACAAACWSAAAAEQDTSSAVAAGSVSMHLLAAQSSALACPAAAAVGAGRRLALADSAGRTPAAVWGSLKLVSLLLRTLPALLSVATAAAAAAAVAPTETFLAVAAPPAGAPAAPAAEGAAKWVSTAAAVPSLRADELGGCAVKERRPLLGAAAAGAPVAPCAVRGVMDLRALAAAPAAAAAAAQLVLPRLGAETALLPPALPLPVLVPGPDVAQLGREPRADTGAALLLLGPLPAAGREAALAAAGPLLGYMELGKDALPLLLRKHWSPRVPSRSLWAAVSATLCLLGFTAAAGLPGSALTAPCADRLTRAAAAGASQMLSRVWRAGSQATLVLLLTLHDAASAASVLLTCCAFATEVRRCAAGSESVEALSPLFA
jgi:hypothetical protein